MAHEPSQRSHELFHELLTIKSLTPAALRSIHPYDRTHHEVFTDSHTFEKRGRAASQVMARANRFLSRGGGYRVVDSIAFELRHRKFIESVCARFVCRPLP